MFEVNCEGGKIEAEVTFGTALVYENEFMRDIIKDVFSVQSDDNEFLGVDGEEIVKVDFTKIGWNETMRALWAAAKTHDPSLDGFEKWMGKVRGVNMWEARMILVAELTDCFFRAEAAGQETKD